MRARACGGLWEPRRKKDSSQIRVHEPHSGGPSIYMPLLSPAITITVHMVTPASAKRAGGEGGDWRPAGGCTGAHTKGVLSWPTGVPLPPRPASGYARVVGRGRQSDSRMLVVRSSGSTGRRSKKPVLTGRHVSGSTARTRRSPVHTVDGRSAQRRTVPGSSRSGDFPGVRDCPPHRVVQICRRRNHNGQMSDAKSRAVAQPSRSGLAISCFVARCQSRGGSRLLLEARRDV